VPKRNPRYSKAAASKSSPTVISRFDPYHGLNGRLPFSTPTSLLLGLGALGLADASLDSGNVESSGNAAGISAAGTFQYVANAGTETEPRRLISPLYRPVVVGGNASELVSWDVGCKDSDISCPTDEDDDADTEAALLPLLPLAPIALSTMSHSKSSTGPLPALHPLPVEHPTQSEFSSCCSFDDQHRLASDSRPQNLELHHLEHPCAAVNPRMCCFSHSFPTPVNPCLPLQINLIAKISKP
jgi:hypothetical protein